MNGPNDNLTQTLPRCKKAWSGGGSAGAHESSYPLADDLLQRARRRLGYVGLIYAFCFVAFHTLWTLTVRQEPRLVLRFADAILVCAVVSGVGMFAVSRWAKWPPCRVLTFGLIFEVIGALLISLSENCVGFDPADLIRGHSAIAIWIVYFILLVPVKWERTLAFSLGSAAMGPLGLLFHVYVMGITPPTMGQFVLINSAPFLMVAATAPLSRYLYSLGAQVTKARETGSYELVERIGAGGMGEVWRARHRMLARPAAVKLIKTYSPNGDDHADSARKRFEREARATAALQSPHTVTLYDYGVTDEGALYYAMELVQGMDLEDLVKKHGPQPPERVAHILMQICDSLAEAHTHGLLHRDIKPRNILLGRLGLEFDFVKVVDFGLVKALGTKSEQTQLTQDGTTTGTPAYMAPEVLMGDGEPDERSDLYGVGCVAYWLLTGHNVFEAKTAMAMALEHVQKKPVPPSDRVETPIPPALEQAILQCLEKNPEHRPQSALELKSMLNRAIPSTGWDHGLAAHWWEMNAPDVVAAGRSRPDLN